MSVEHFKDEDSKNVNFVKQMQVPSQLVKYQIFPPERIPCYHELPACMTEN